MPLIRMNIVSASGIVCSSAVNETWFFGPGINDSDVYIDVEVDLDSIAMRRASSSRTRSCKAEALGALELSGTAFVVFEDIGRSSTPTSPWSTSSSVTP